MTGRELRWKMENDEGRTAFRNAFRQKLDELTEKFLQGKAQGTTKMAVRTIINKSASEIVEIEFKSLKEAFDALEGVSQKLEKLNALKDELAEIEDPRARTALYIYRTASNDPYADEFRTSEDMNCRQRRITAAGLMASAYLGLQGYEVSNQASQYEHLKK